MKYKTYLLNSLDTVFYDSDISKDTLKYTGIFENEAFSFQMAFRADYEQGEANGWDDVIKVRAEVISEIKDSVTVYAVENVPAVRVGYSISDDWFLRKSPGLYPDCMQTNRKNNFSAPVGYWKNIWINVNENLDKLSANNYKITIRLYNCKTNTVVSEKTVTIKVMKGVLPKQRIKMTNWMHYDCIAYFSNTRPFSKAFCEAARKYIRMAAANGQNMILLPAFTPPLDTPVGEERATVQLVDVTLKNGEYIFDLSRLKKFIEMCLECGIEYFEHSHLYTQWGAEHAPKIIVCVNGKKKKLFGWHTDALSAEYKKFIHSYLSELKKFIKQNGYEKRFFFHISDEPEEKHLKNYKAVSDFIHKELEGYPSGDALSEYKFYEDGVVQTPIALTHTANEFLGRANPLWLYYTGYQCGYYLSNRLIGMPRERGRILGVQLYYFKIDGFLNWGFNAHHNALSRKMIDPRAASDMDGDFVSGSSYLVYPNGREADPSVRLMTVRDQMQDIRAMQLLEALTDRENVCDLIKKYIPDIRLNCRVTAAQILDLRDEVNARIKSLIDA